MEKIKGLVKAVFPMKEGLSRRLPESPTKKKKKKAGRLRSGKAKRAPQQRPRVEHN